MKLFIANCLKQNVRLFYRLDIDKDGAARPESRFRAPKHQDIPMGKQVMIAGDMHQNAVDDIVEQLRPYGLAGVVDVKGGRLTGVTPYVFDIDRQISTDVIRDVHAFNDGVLMRDGKTLRQAAALAASQIIGTDKLEVSIEQETVSELDESPIEEGFRIQKDPVDAPRGGKGRGRR